MASYPCRGTRYRDDPNRPLRRAPVKGRARYTVVLSKIRKVPLPETILDLLRGETRYEEQLLPIRARTRFIDAPTAFDAGTQLVDMINGMLSERY